MTRLPDPARVRADAPLLPVVTGVYFLFRKGALEYIGRSKNCYARIEEHRRNGREFDYASVMALPEADMAWVEAELIRAMETRKNRTGTATQKTAEKAIKEPAIRLVERVIMREVPVVVPNQIEPALVRVAEAQRIAGQHFKGLSQELWRAANDGSLPTIPTDNGRPGAGWRLVRMTDLGKWIDTRLSELGAAPSAGDAQ
jgi:hypothetical protein